MATFLNLQDNLLTGAKRPAFSTNQWADIDKTKRHQDHKNVSNQLEKLPKCTRR